MVFIKPGRKAFIEKGTVRLIDNDAIGPVDIWVCPHPNDAAQPFEIGACSECGAPIAFRDTEHARSCVKPNAPKVCIPCTLIASLLSD